MNQILSPSDFIVTFLILTMKFNCFKKVNIVKGVQNSLTYITPDGFVLQISSFCCKWCYEDHKN